MEKYVFVIINQHLQLNREEIFELNSTQLVEACQRATLMSDLQFLPLF